MSLELLTVKYYRLYLVVFDQGDEGEINEKTGYFSSDIEAEKIANLKIGCWGSKGRIIVKDIKTNENIPSYYKTAKEWARKHLTIEEYEESNI